MSPVNSLWFKWKSLRLPWRRSFLIGSDLNGNTFWEFKDVVNTNRFRRIVKYNRKAHYADVKISPQWHQWLRYVREHPPSLQEQQGDLVRQAQLKQLARLADERWASKPSYLDAPRKPQGQQPHPATKTTGDTSEMPASPATATAFHNAVETPGRGEVEKEATRPVEKDGAQDSRDEQSTVSGAKNPWAASDRSGPSEKWQPESWTPSASRR